MSGVPTLTTYSPGVGVFNADWGNTVVQGGALLTNLRNYPGLSNMTVWMTGTAVPGDGGQGMFYWNGSATAADDGGLTTIAVPGVPTGRWIRQTSSASPMSIRSFGAALDGVTDDTAAWNAGLAWANTTGGALYHPGGNSIYTGNMVLTNQSLLGVGSYHQVPGQSVSQESMIIFHGDDAGLTLANAESGGVTIEKIGFQGVPGTYSNQTGFLMSDTLRPDGQNEGWPTLRDVLFADFNIGMDVGETYQTGFLFNVFFYQSIEIGYRNEALDWYHWMVTCGSSTNIATDTQLQVGPATSTDLPIGGHFFHGCLFFGGNVAGRITCSQANTFINCYFQNATTNGLVIGDGTNGVYNTTLTACTFSGNNQAGGVRNANAQNNVDLAVNNAVRSLLVSDCLFAQNAAASVCVSYGISIGGTNNTGIAIHGCRFNMDNIVTVGSGSPLPIEIPSAVTLDGANYLMIADNMASYGENAINPAQILPVNMAFLFALAPTAGTMLAIESGGIYIGGTDACNLPNPGFGGRLLSLSGNVGSSFSTATPNSLNGTDTTCTFQAGGWINLLSDTATNWIVMGSGAVTLS